MSNFKNKEEYEKWKAERLKTISEKKTKLKNSENDVPVQKDNKRSRNKLKRVLIFSVLLIVILGSLSYLYYFYRYQPKKVYPKYQLHQPKKVAVDISGNWTGVVTTENSETILFEFTLVQDRETTFSSIKGNGSLQISGSLVKSYCDVSGYFKENENISLSFSDSGFFIVFEGTAGVSQMTGTVKGNNLKGVEINDGYVVFIKK